MKFIEEVVVEEFLPTYRSLLAADLRDRGLTQSEVADLLGISQSAVSKYATGAVEVNGRVAGDERVRELVAGVGQGLASGELSRVGALAEAEVLVRQLEQDDLLAKLHEAAFPPLAEYEGGFDVHDPDSGLRASERVLSSVRQGLRTLEESPAFAALVPAVGSNLVEALPEATHVEDVAAVPGRILDVKGRAAVPADPEFGVSVYVASVLLAARRAGHEARAACNVRYTPAIVEALAGLGRDPVEFDAVGEAAGAGGAGQGDADDIDTAVADALAGAPDADVLYQTGGFGVEPIVYVLGPDAATVAGRVRDLAEHVR
ncbi:DNA-binding protein [Haloglomus irregulare]|uniref:DNA-binding protein n=1 Tax=Haloglomus irregulare TaxID=2234134 RepID=A0A554NEV7_9EURY|nr:thiamine-phosphate synthase family protein [Haloglomus irregulare]TSD15937.1 DNA-binding protein [Haloglomus irregulare]